MHTPKDMLHGTIHATNNYGGLRILKYISSSNVDVEFIDTRFKTNTQSSNIRLGTVADMHDMEVGFIHDCGKYGHVKVIEYVSSSSVLIRFLSTGFDLWASSSSIRKGSVCDRLFKSVFSVGFIGRGLFNSSNDKTAYTKWHSMMQRCYSTTYQIKKPSYIGCSVCDEWHNFQTFAKWHYKNYINDGSTWDLDKDIKIKGNRIYSEDACAYVTPKENYTARDDSKRINKEIISPSGKVVNVWSQAEFSILNGINKASLCRLLNGSQKKSHGGWKSIYKST